MTDLDGAFPWLTGAYADLAASQDADEALVEIAKTAMEERDSWFLPVLAPFVPADYPLEDLRLSPRPANRLRDGNMKTFRDLETWAIRDLFAIRHMGAGSIHEIVRGILKANLDHFRTKDLPETSSSGARDKNLHGSLEDWAPVVPEHNSLAAAHLETLAHWSELVKISV